MYLITAAILFGLGALGGLYMAVRSFRGQSIPGPVAALHGVLVAAGLVLLLIGVLAGLGQGPARVALAILVLAALGGFFLLSYHLRKERHPKAVIVVHALVAVAGFLTLLVALYQSLNPAS